MLLCNFLCDFCHSPGSLWEYVLMSVFMWSLPLPRFSGRLSFDVILLCDSYYSLCMFSVQWFLSLFGRAGNSLIGFRRKSLVFCPKMSKWAIHSKKWTIHSFAHFWWATWAICSPSLISSERPERFTYIAHQKRGNEQLTHFLNKKTYIKYTKKQDFRFF